MSAFSSLARPASRYTSSAVATGPLLPFLYPALYGKDTESSHRRVRHLHRAATSPSSHRSRNRPTHTPQQMENVFITALARASCCQSHISIGSSVQRPIRSASSYQKLRRRPVSRVDVDLDGSIDQKDGRRHGSAATAERRDVTQEELISMVDVYPMHDTAPARHRPPSLPEPDDQPLTISIDHESARKRVPFDQKFDDAIKKLTTLVHDANSDGDDLFAAYEALPYPRASFLNPKLRLTFLHRLAVIPWHDETTLLRYLSVMDDIKAANLRPPRIAWNSAIHLAAHPWTTVTDAEAESALYIWKDMEQRQGIIGDEVTFNILFNVAIKAHKFALADMIIQELESRGLRKTTPFRIGAIFRAGQQHDGDSVRRAYREFVEAGEIVTTTVLNCVITSLYEAGESGGAEAIFERMRTVYGADKDRDIPPEEFFAWRAYVAALQKDVEHLRNDPVARQEAQNRAPLRPDSHTFRIMMRAACRQNEGLDRVDELLAQMREIDPPLQLSRAMFTNIFYGFARFGKRPYSTIWSRGRLELKWLNYLTEFERDPLGFAFTRKVAIVILRAFLMCCGKKRMWQIWPEIRSRWNRHNDHKGTGMTLEDLAVVERWVRRYGTSKVYSRYSIMGGYPDHRGGL